MALQRDERPEIPDPASCRGGTFAGMPQYLELMQRCWETDPSERPPVKDVVCSLRELLEMAMNTAGKAEPPWTPTTSSVSVCLDINAALNSSGTRPPSQCSHKSSTSPKSVNGPMAKAAALERCEKLAEKCETAMVKCGSAEDACRVAVGRCEEAAAKCEKVAMKCDQAQQDCAREVQRKGSEGDEILESIRRLLSDSRSSGSRRSFDMPGYHMLGTPTRSVGAVGEPTFASALDIRDGLSRHKDAIWASPLPNIRCGM